MKTLLTIWTQPRQTFEYLDNNENPESKINFNLLFYLGALAMTLPGIPQMTLKNNTLNSLPVAISIFFSLIGCMIAAFLLTLIFKYVHAYVFWIIGKALQGKASRLQVQGVIAYAMIPGLISLLISIILIIIALFLNDINVIGYQNPFTLMVIWLLGVRILIYGIATYNRFSYGYALLNFIVFATFIQGIQLLIKYIMN